MDLDLAGQKVVAQESEYAVVLLLSGGYEVRIECRFLVCVDGASYEVEPAPETDVSRFAGLTGRVVTAARSDDSGGLRIDLDGGAWVVVAADPDYEAWTVAGPGGFKAVSGPGGDVAVWKQQG